MPQNGRFSITPEEYQAIPPTLQRKCFSTLERLRYAEAQASLDVPPKTSNLDKVNSRLIITSQSISRLRETIKSIGLLHQTSDRLLPPGSAYTVANVTQEDALWFARLPDKVKRGYFSIAEERLLSVETNSDIDKGPCKIGKLSNKSLSSIDILSERTPDDITLHSFEAEDMDAHSIKSFRSMNTDSMSMDDYHKMLAQARATVFPPRRSSSMYSLRPSIAMSEGSTIDSEGVATPSTDESQFLPITRLPPEELLDEWGSGWAPMPSKSNRRMKPSKLQTIHSREASMVLLEQVKSTMPVIAPRTSSSRPRPDAHASAAAACPTNRPACKKASEIPKLVAATTESAAPVDSPAAYYLDPEARLKLRMYLASASKFDEVVEFGFPSLTNQDTTTSIEVDDGHADLRRPRTASKMETFARRSGLHTMDELIRSGTAHGPSSPIASSDTYSIPYKSLPDQDPILSRDPRTRIQAQLRKFDRDPFGCSTEREMTIRMTLTRPDLRADESELYPQTQQAYKGKIGSSNPRTEEASHTEQPRAFANHPHSTGQRTFSLKRLLKRN